MTRASSTEVQLNNSRHLLSPIPESYWIVPGQLLAGPYPGSLDISRVRQKLEMLNNIGIRNFIDLTPVGELSTSGNVLRPYRAFLPSVASYSHFPVVDRDAPSGSRMSEILDCIDRGIGDNIPTYLHCRGGKFRTGTVVACYLVRHGIAFGDAAIRMNAELRRFHDAGALDLRPRQKAIVYGWRLGQ